MVNVTITSYLTHSKSAGFTPWVITKSECDVVFRIYRDRLLPWLPNPMRLVSLCNLQFPVKSTLEKNKLAPTFTPWINQNWQSCDSLNKTFLEGKRLDHKDDISCQCLLSIQCIRSSFLWILSVHLPATFRDKVCTLHTWTYFPLLNPK